MCHGGCDSISLDIYNPYVCHGGCFLLQMLIFLILFLKSYFVALISMMQWVISCPLNIVLICEEQAVREDVGGGI